MTAMWRRAIGHASISRRRISISSLPPNSSVGGCNAQAGVWSIGMPDNRRASQCIIAKAETLEQRATFREAFQQRRFVVPADGFYEWTGPKGKRQPLWIHPRAGDLMLFAGLYESWYREQNKPEVTFTIVTCAANGVIGEIHDRMPVILDERASEDWMDPREEDPLSLKRLLVPAPSELLVIQPASPLANSVKNEGPGLLEL
jgi:putative SOS response-associated peptidase YedK